MLNQKKYKFCSTEKDASEILPGLWLGNHRAATNIEFINKYSIECIINVSKDVPNIFNNIDYLHIPINDSDICSYDIQRLMKIYDIATKFIYHNLINNRNILVHCKRGHHRSACIVAAYIIKYYEAEYINAIVYINSIRKCALVRNTCMTKALLKYFIIKNILKL